MDCAPLSCRGAVSSEIFISLVLPILRIQTQHRTSLRSRLRTAFCINLSRHHHLFPLMADPLSIAASAGGLALLARDVYKGLDFVIRTARTARSELQALRQSVALLHGCLQSLSLIVDEEEDAPTPQSILSCNTTLDEIKRIIKKCEPETKTPPTSSKLATLQNMKQKVEDKVQWIVEKEQVQKLLAVLERHKSVLSLALSKESVSSILQVLKKQDEAAQKMEELRKGQSEIRERQIQDAEMRLSKERREMLDDFSKIRPDIPFKKHLSLRQNGAGVWLLQSSEFQKFMKIAEVEALAVRNTGRRKTSFERHHDRTHECPSHREDWIRVLFLRIRR